MIAVKVNVRAATPEDSKQQKPQQDLSIPTQEQILTQLQTHFGDSETQERLVDLSNQIHSEFLKLEGQPYSGFAKYMPEKPVLLINVYRDAWNLFERERYSADYSPLTMYTHLGYHITVVHSVKRVQLSYVKQS